MIRFERGDWLGQVFSFHGTVVETLWRPVLAYFFYCIVMFLVADYIQQRFSHSRLVRDDTGSLHFLGGFVSFLLIFQLNQSYIRFTRGIELSADFFNHLFGVISLVFTYLKRNAVPIDDELLLAAVRSTEDADLQRREISRLLTLATEVHVLRLVLAIGASLKFHFRITEQVLSGGRLGLEQVQLLLFDLHRVRGLLLPNEQAIVDLASGLCLEDDDNDLRPDEELESSGQRCHFRVRLNYQEQPSETGSRSRSSGPRVRRLGACPGEPWSEESCVGMELPLLLVQLLRGHLAQAMLPGSGSRSWGFPERIVNAIEKHLTDLCCSFEHMDRLITMPFPLAYLQHGKSLFLIFTLVYPLCLEIELGFWANVISPTIIFFALLGFELLADEMENPLGTGQTDLNILEMVHTLELRACKAFAVAEAHEEALREDARGLLRGLGLAPRAPAPPEAAQEPDRRRSFSQHFRWVRLPRHVVRDIGRQASSVPSDLGSSPRRLPACLRLLQAAGISLRRCWRARRRRRRRSRSGPDYGVLDGCEEDRLAAEEEEELQDWDDFLDSCVSHFVCLRSQEETMRSICSEMQGCLSEQELVGVRLARRLTGGEAAVSRGGLSPVPRSRTSKADFADEARTETGRRELSAVRASGPLPEASAQEKLPSAGWHSERHAARKYTEDSHKLAQFALRFTPASTPRPAAVGSARSVAAPCEASTPRPAAVGAARSLAAPKEGCSPRPDVALLEAGQLPAEGTEAAAGEECGRHSSRREPAGALQPSDDCAAGALQPSDDCAEPDTGQGIQE